MAGFDILAGLAGAAASAYGANLNAQSVAATNQQNMLMNTGDWRATQLRDEAARLGVSPLALLGNTGSSIPMQAVQSDLSGVGAGLQVAARGAAPADNQLRDLQLQRLQLENAGLAQDLVARQARTSVNAVTKGQAGLSPVWAAGMEGSPYFGPINPFGGPHPELVRFAGGAIGRSKEKAESDFAGDFPATIVNTFKSAERSMNEAGGGVPSPGSFLRRRARELTGEEAQDAYEVRPDILRRIYRPSTTILMGGE